MSVDIGDLSPNQLAKRREIVSAARDVLLSVGINAFTTRTLADRSSIGRGQIHYYFDSVEQIVDAAMEDNLATFTAGLAEAAIGHDDPTDRFWAVVEAYLGFFVSQRDIALLWFDYTISSARAGQPQRVLDTELKLRDMLRDLLSDCGIADADARAEALLAYMFGATLRSILHPNQAANLRKQLSGLSGID